jgi:type I restriction enzyme S subunit
MNMETLSSIPDGWKIAELKNLLTSAVLGGNYENGSEDGGVPLIKMGNIGRGRIVLNKVEFLPKNTTYSNEYVLKKGDLLLNTRNTLDLVGKVAIWRDELSLAVYNSNLLKMSFDESQVASNFFMNYYFNSELGIRQLRGFATGTTSVAAIYNKDLVKFKVVLPTLIEQEVITTILSTVDEKIEVIEAQIAETQQLKKGLMQRLLTKGIGHTKFKQSELGEIPESWEVVKLGDVGAFSKGAGITKSQLVETGIPCVRYGEIYTVHHYVIKKFYSFIPKEVADTSKQLICGDILFAGSGETVEEIGKAVAYVNTEEAYAGGDIVIFSSERFNSVFLSYALNDPIVTKQRVKFGQGNSVVHIYARDLAKLLVPMPTKQEQDSISEIFRTVDEKIDVLNMRRDSVVEMKKGLMQKLLTGQIRVKLPELV